MLLPKTASKKHICTMLDHDETNQLLMAVAEKDVAAFRALYNRTSGRLMAVICGICRDRQQAEDVLQEVYVQVWRRADSFDRDLGSAVTWLSVIARHRAIDHIRRRGRDIAVMVDDGNAVIETIAALTAGVEQSLDLRTLSGCLGRLDPTHSQAILLAYYNGWSGEELARHFGIPENTIKTWLRRGLISLRACMGAK